MPSKYRAPRGTHDVLPEEAPRWRRLEGLFREVCERYGYREIRTPIFEEAELFIRSVGETTDIVTKEMYVFEDRAGRRMALKPEGTAPVIRAYIEHGLQAKGGLVKLYYITPIFRYEKPQAGRYRQAHQMGVEAIGSMDPALDAEVIDLAVTFLKEAGLEGFELLLNSVGCPQCRPKYKDALLEYAHKVGGDLCEDCKRRMVANPLRLLDCKEPSCKGAMEGAPSILDFLCRECKEHFEAVRRYLEGLGIGYTLEPHLVRGLDYYTKTAFEIVHGRLGAQNAVCGGGRYDGLVEECGGPPTPAIGFAIGVERTLLALGEGPEADERPKVMAFVIALGDRAKEEAVRLTSELRRAGVPTEADYLGRSLKAQMRAADKAGAKFAVIIGERELEKGRVALRDMRTGEQTEVPREEVTGRLCEALRSINPCPPG